MNSNISQLHVLLCMIFDCKYTVVLSVIKHRYTSISHKNEKVSKHSTWNEKTWTECHEI